MTVAACGASLPPQTVVPASEPESMGGVDCRQLLILE